MTEQERLHIEKEIKELESILDVYRIKLKRITDEYHKVIDNLTSKYIEYGKDNQDETIDTTKR